MTDDWLPELMEFNQYGNWDTYLDAIYDQFLNDFVRSKPTWPGKRFSLKRHPEFDGKNATFWHMISKGNVEEDRPPDFRRCERIAWPRSIIDRFPDQPPTSKDPILWWKNKRGSENRILLSLPDFSYLVVMADRGSYIMPRTAYPVEYPSQRRKLEREYTSFWQNSTPRNG